jgi:hypothetical protein
MSVPQQGNEKRAEILPKEVPKGIGFFGSPYNPADAMKTPLQIGVKSGDTMEDVINAVKGVGFYVDQIGFGAPSTRLTNGMPLKPLGVNYFIKTGATCSNGATMWQYMQGITEGNALGPKMKKVMADMGLPPLQGLAPGMIEDAQNGLNPEPLMNALFGSGYPQCKQVTLPVGDAYGRIADDTTGEEWISDPHTAKKRSNGYVQTQWVQDTHPNGKPINLSRDEWVSAKKTFKPDGTPIKTKIDAFKGFMMKPGTVVVVGILCLFAMACVKRR